MSAKSFTERQGQYLAFIDAYTRVHSRPPAETDMQRHFRVSPPSVHQMVLTLERLVLIPPAGGGAQHRGAPRPRRPARPTPSRTRQILCAEELGGGVAAASRELGVQERDARRAVEIASLVA